MSRKIKQYLLDVLEGAGIQINVIRALYYRELLTRVSKSNFGIIGLYIEPLAGIAILLFIFGIRRGFSPVLGVDLFLFLGCGIIIYNIFRSICIRSLASIQANKALFTYKRVKAIDTIIARTIVEFFSLGTIYVFFILGYSIIKETWYVSDLPLILFSYICISLISLGLGLIVMISGYRYPVMQSILPIVLRPLYFCSGVFFSLQNLPQWLKPWLSWNPILQAIELSRKGLSKTFILDPLISINYLFCCVIVTITFGLFVYQNNERLLLKE